MKKQYLLICIFCGFLGLFGLIMTMSALAPSMAQAEEFEQADLVVKGEINRLQDYVFPGNQGIYWVEIENIGTKRAEGVTVTFYFLGQAECDWTVDVDPGSTDLAWCGYSASVIGDLHAEVEIDTRYSILEINEDNNSAYQRFIVSPPQERPDIIVAEEITFTPLEIHTGDDVMLSVLLSNPSAWPTGRFMSVWYIDELIPEWCEYAVDLAPFETKEVTCLLKDLAQQDTLSINFVVDETDRLAETDENNNSAGVSLNILAAREKPYEYIAEPEETLELEANESELAAPELGDEQVLGAADEATEPVISGPLSFEDLAQQLLDGLEVTRNLEIEIQMIEQFSADLQAGMPLLPEAAKVALVDFMSYGVDENTTKLGAGERAAVLFSYKDAYGKLPSSMDELADVIRIANGRWPREINLEAQEISRREFWNIYKRNSDMSHPNDNAAITIMTYGLKQKWYNRNLESERAGIEIFEAIYGHKPQSTRDWNYMQAITYSGASQ